MRKYLKYIILILIFYNNVFAGIDFSLFVPIYETISIVNKKIYSQNYFNEISTDIYFSTGVISEIGYNFKFDNKYINSISILGSIGYMQVNLPMKYDNYTLGRFYEVTFLHTLNTGASVKIINNLTNYNLSYSIGIGGGIKTPFGGYIINQLAATDESVLTGKEEYNFNDIKNVFKSVVIPYIKIDINLYYHLTKNVSFMAGLYFNYDFAFKYNTDYINDYFTSISGINSKVIDRLEVSSFSVGVSLGFAIRDNGY
ncbi:hypothetical protein BRSU_2444 [Brachyspira suanatina]|uniref:Serpentine_recp domain containing protein n=1 Tax=Brachyspira suanatina TaxID=381802 RepID=A0A0G4KA36_9SPIR|nr:hypothetical protein [Brachyspira suanatina]CRF35121.1 hypothetical protein BRSU_2444 [Brachyspira suanatina]